MICTPCNRSTEADVCDAPAAHNPYGWVDGVRWCERFALRPTQPSLFAPASSPHGAGVAVGGGGPAPADPHGNHDTCPVGATTQGETA